MGVQKLLSQPENLNKAQKLAASAGLTIKEVIAYSRRTAYDGNPSDNHIELAGTKNLGVGDLVILTKFTRWPDIAAVILEVDRIGECVKVVTVEDGDETWHRKDGLRVLGKNGELDNVPDNLWAMVKTKQESVDYYAPRRAHKEACIDFAILIEPWTRGKV